jgi:hypothetical protein
MATNAKKLFDPAFLPTGAPIMLYTCGGPSGPNPQLRAIVEKFAAKNSSPNSVTYTVYLVPAGQAPAAVNAIVGPASLSPAGLKGDTDVPAALQRQVLHNGDALWAVASAGTAVTLFASGSEIS